MYINNYFIIYYWLLKYLNLFYFLSEKLEKKYDNKNYNKVFVEEKKN